jgi:heme oxygenase
VSVTVGRRHAGRLSARLWAASSTHHDRVRRTAFITALTARRLPWKAYADWAAQQFFLHESLGQAESAMAGVPAGWALIRPESAVLSSLAVDLRFLHGPGWAYRIAARPTTTTYCTRLRDVAVGHACGYVVHHYTRHVEDLYAGRYLGPSVAAAYGLGDAGCRFLLPGDADPSLFRVRYGDLIDAVPWSAADMQAMVAETAYAHQLYLDLLEELGRCWT